MRSRWQAACLLSVTLQACTHGGFGNLRPSPAQSTTIGLSIQNEQYPFYQAMVYAMRQTILTRAYPYQLRVKNADSSAAQLAQVEDFIRQGVDAIVLVPVDSQEVDPAILEANTAGIPVFTTDIRDETGEQRVAASITSDNVGGGERAGKALCNASLEGSSILILDQPGITSVRDRVLGFRRTMWQCHHSIPPDLNGGTSSDSATKALKAVLGEQRHLGAVFAVNDTMAFGALRAIHYAKCHGMLSGHVQIVGYDGSPEAVAAVGKGEMFAEIIQDPQKLGSLTVQQIHDYFAKQSHQMPTPVPVSIYLKGAPIPTSWTSASPLNAEIEGDKCK